MMRLLLRISTADLETVFPQRRTSLTRVPEKFSPSRKWIFHVQLHVLHAFALTLFSTSSMVT